MFLEILVVLVNAVIITAQHNAVLSLKLLSNSANSCTLVVEQNKLSDQAAGMVTRCYLQVASTGHDKLVQFLVQSDDEERLPIRRVHNFPRNSTSTRFTVSATCDADGSKRSFHSNNLTIVPGMTEPDFVGPKLGGNSSSSAGHGGKPVEFRDNKTLLTLCIAGLVFVVMLVSLAIVLIVMHQRRVGPCSHTRTSSQTELNTTEDQIAELRRYVQQQKNLSTNDSVI